MSFELKHVFFLLPALISFCTGSAFAQSEYFQPRFEHISVNNGLSHSDAMAVACDQDGFIWIGTNKGLDKYNGYSIKNYPIEVNNTIGLSDNRIRSLYASDEGELWVGTENGGLNYYDKNNDQLVRVDSTLLLPIYSKVAILLSNSDVSCISSYNSRQLFIGTLEHGLFVLERDANKKILSLKRIPINKNQTDYGVRCLEITSNKEVWVGTSSSGLFLLQPDLTLEKAKLHSLNIQALHVDYNRNLWVGADQKIFLLPKALMAGEFLIAEPKGINSFPGLTSLHLDSLGRMWTGTTNGLFLIYSNKDNTVNHSIEFTHIEKFLPKDGISTSLSSSRIHQIIEDRFNTIWIATSAGGLNKVNLLNKGFGHLQRQSGEGITMASNYVNAIYQEKNKPFLWIGTRNGISKYDLKKRTYFNYYCNESEGSTAGVDVNSIFEDSDNNLWFGTWSDGFIRLSRSGAQEKWERHTVPERHQRITEKANAFFQGSRNNAVSFAEDANGFIWIATFGDGLSKYDKQGHLLKEFTMSSSLPSDKLVVLLYDKQRKVLWASTADVGLLKLELKGDSISLQKHFTNSTFDTLSLGANYCWPLFLDHRNNLWVGTLGGGLHKLITDSLGNEIMQRYNKRIPESDVESILEDSLGNLWIGGKGIIKFNPESKQFFRFDVSDGLQSNSFKVGAAFHAADGTFYFGGINGINYFKPKNITLNPHAPNVIITGLRIFNIPVNIGQKINNRVILNKNIELTSEIEIKSTENDFSIEFVGLQLANPGKNVHAFKLNGYHKDWIYLQPGQLTASFANLSPGTYTLLVKACNGDGVWSSKMASLRIKVLPPWWETWWAYALYSLLLVVTFQVYRRITKSRQDLEKKLLVEKLQHEKDIQLNKLKSSFFTNVTHELRTPLTLILGPIEELFQVSVSGRLGAAREKIFLIHQQGKKLLDLVNQIMDFQKVESDKLILRMREENVVIFLKEIFAIFKLKAIEKNIDYTLTIEPDEVRMYFDRNKLEIVFVNLLSNAFKYTPESGKIHLSLSVIGDKLGNSTFIDGEPAQNYVSIMVKDWGVGINPNEVDKIFDAYYQATHTETMQMMGTGLGLTLVKKIIDRHNGEIKIKSEVGIGTEFNIKLPLGKIHLSSDDLQFSTTSNDESNYKVEMIDEGSNHKAFQIEDIELVRSSRLLIVEDNEDVLRYLQQLFESLVIVYTAEDGVKGLEKALDVIPDIIISDIMMPHENGLELCRKIKQNPKTMHIPVLLLTARVASAHELEGFEMGADDYIIKPFNPRIIQAKVMTILINRLKLREFYNRQILLEPAAITIPDADRSFLELAMNVVEKNLEETSFSVQVLIREMGMSQSVFYRKLKSITGLSAIEFITDIRMKRAAQLLLESDLRISEIAYKVGVEDVKYFRKIFRQRFGISPSEFANKNEL